MCFHIHAYRSSLPGEAMRCMIMYSFDVVGPVVKASGVSGKHIWFVLFLVQQHLIPRNPQLPNVVTSLTVLQFLMDIILICITAGSISIATAEVKKIM